VRLKSPNLGCDVFDVEIGATQAASASKSVDQSYEGAMLKKINDVAKVQGEAALSLIDSATPSRPPTGTGSMINDVA